MGKLNLAEMTDREIINEVFEGSEEGLAADATNPSVVDWARRLIGIVQDRELGE